MQMHFSDFVQVGRGDGTRITKRYSPNDHERLLRHCCEGTVPGSNYADNWSGVTDFVMRNAGATPIIPSEPWNHKDRLEWMNKGFLITGRVWKGRPFDLKVHRCFDKASERVMEEATGKIPGLKEACQWSDKLIQKIINALYLEEGSDYSMTAVTRRKYIPNTQSTLFIGFCGLKRLKVWPPK